MAQASRKQQLATATEPVSVQPVEVLPPAAAESTGSIVVPLTPAASPLDLPSAVFQAALERRQSNRAALVNWIRSALVENVDFGSIPTKRGPSKPSLWKAGAEKICGMLGVTVHFPTLPEYERAALTGVVLESIILRCELHDASGRVVADGIGARSLKQDYGDLNKALKMAEKSGHIDATLRMAGLSEVFTQDLEDQPLSEPLQPQSRRAENGSNTTKEPAKEQPIGLQSTEHRHLEAQIKELGLNREGVKIWCQRRWQLEHFQDLTEAQYRELLATLPKMAEAKAKKAIAAKMARQEEATAQAEAQAEREAIQAEEEERERALMVDPYFSNDIAEQFD